jgi:hypothetical protein
MRGLDGGEMDAQRADRQAAIGAAHGIHRHGVGIAIERVAAEVGSGVAEIGAVIARRLRPHDSVRKGRLTDGL